MKKIWMGLLVAVTLAVYPGCSSSSSDTTAQIINELTNALIGDYTVEFRMAGATMTSRTGVYSSKTKLNNCDTQTSTVVHPLVGNISFAGTQATCGKHNLYRFTLDAFGNYTLYWKTGDVQ